MLLEHPSVVEINDVSAAVEEIMKNMEGLEDVKSTVQRGSPEVRIRFNREKLIRYGLDTASLAQMISDMVRGKVATRYMSSERKIDILVRVDQEDLSRVEELEKRISTLEGNLTGNLSYLQRSVDVLGEKLKSRDAATSKKLNSISAGIEERFRAMAVENRELLTTIEEARKASYTTGYEHFVESGETLGGIARSYGVTVQAIMDANDMDDPDTLTVGQKLFVPK